MKKKGNEVLYVLIVLAIVGLGILAYYGLTGKDDEDVVKISTPFVIEEDGEPKQVELEIRVNKQTPDQ